MTKRLICLLLGHNYDWNEYDMRMELEGHYGAGKMVYCSRCKRCKSF